MKKDTAPFIRSARVKRLIRIEEKNDGGSLLFDTIVEYPSNELPEWFQPLQPIVEDHAFTSMVINNNSVHYHITIVKKEDLEHEDAPHLWEYREECTCGICYRHRQHKDADTMEPDSFDELAYGESTAE